MGDVDSKFGIKKTMRSIREEVFANLIYSLNCCNGDDNYFWKTPRATKIFLFVKDTE